MPVVALQTRTFFLLALSFLPGDGWPSVYASGRKEIMETGEREILDIARRRSHRTEEVGLCQRWRYKDEDIHFPIRIVILLGEDGWMPKTQRPNERKWKGKKKEDRCQNHTGTTNSKRKQEGEREPTGTYIRHRIARWKAFTETRIGFCYAIRKAFEILLDISSLARCMSVRWDRSHSSSRAFDVLAL